MSRTFENLRNVYDLVALMRKAPRTQQELSSVTGIHANTVSVHVKLMLDEGLIECVGRSPRREGRVGLTSMVYRWLEREQAAIPDFNTTSPPPRRLKPAIGVLSVCRCATVRT